MSPTKPALQFGSPEDAEAAFYEAIRHSRLDQLMHIWSEDEEIVCVHPNGQRLSGHDAIRQSWRAILGNGRRLRVDLARAVRWTSMLMSVHSVIEQVVIEGGTTDEGDPAVGEGGTLTLAATNVFIRGADGWKLLSHHSSAVSDETPQESMRPPRTLH